MPDGHADHDPSITGVLDRAQTAAGGDTVSVGEVVEALGTASHAAVMALAALIVVSPASGIPFLSSTGGTIIALTAGQIVFGRRSLWLPGFLLRRKIDSARFCKAVGWLRRPAGFIDRHTRPRWNLLLRRPGRSAVAALCALCGLAMPVLEIVPFSSSLLAAAVLPLAVSLVVRDGAVALVGVLILGGALSAGLWFLVT